MGAAMWLSYCCTLYTIYLCSVYYCSMIHTTHYTHEHITKYITNTSQTHKKSHITSHITKHPHHPYLVPPTLLEHPLCNVHPAQHLIHVPQQRRCPHTPQQDALCAASGCVFRDRFKPVDEGGGMLGVPGALP